MSPDGVTFVKQKGLYGLVDGSGAEFLKKPTYEEVRPFSQGLAAVRQGKNWFYIDRTGEAVFATDYEAAGDFSQGLAPVTAEGKTYFINRNGIPIAGSEAEALGAYQEGIAAYQEDGLWGYRSLAPEQETEPYAPVKGRAEKRSSEESSLAGDEASSAEDHVEEEVASAEEAETPAIESQETGESSGESSRGGILAD